MLKQKNEKTVAFTGHRTYEGEAQQELAAVLRELYAEGYRTFLSGMARGFDLAAAEAVMQLREEFADVQLIAVVPFEGFRSHFRGEDLEIYDRVIDAADERITVSEHRGGSGFFERNDFLADNSSYVVAWWDGIPKGGTYYTVQRARRQHKPVKNLCPQLQLEIFG
ncbi:MAG: DUF1273 family protein [Alistipes sp.]|nr:DUF1273 family protein [Alistipes sp.]